MSEKLPLVIYLGQSEQSRTILDLERRKARLERRKARDRAYEASPERRASKRAYDRAYCAIPENKERKKAYDALRREWGYKNWR
jgi:hypothetical protein